MIMLINDNAIRQKLEEVEGIASVWSEDVRAKFHCSKFGWMIGHAGAFLCNHLAQEFDKGILDGDSYVEVFTEQSYFCCHSCALVFSEYYDKRTNDDKVWENAKAVCSCLVENLNPKYVWTECAQVEAEPEPGYLEALFRREFKSIRSELKRINSRLESRKTTMKERIEASRRPAAEFWTACW